MKLVATHYWNYSCVSLVANAADNGVRRGMRRSVAALLVLVVSSFLTMRERTSCQWIGQQQR
jgi:hypothetical protein